MEVIGNNIEWFSMILFGMVAGSFVTMASYRLAVEDKPIKELIFMSSSCTRCNHKLGFLNLFPILSWIFQKGCCSFCNAKISIRYPIIELVCTISFVLIYFISGAVIDAKLVLLLLIFVTLFVMIITDLEHYFISDMNQIILFILIVLYHFMVTFSGEVQDHGLAYYFFSCAVYLVFGIALHYFFKILTNQEGIGVDDIKFFAIAGFAVGIDKFALFMFLSGIFGIIFGLAWTKIKKEETFPFAPSLVVALIVSLMVNFDNWQIIY
jgi:prepilin signal peptidase PulO-like enzyme (type II secretory pathway)